MSSKTDIPHRQIQEQFSSLGLLFASALERLVDAAESLEQAVAHTATVRPSVCAYSGTESITFQGIDPFRLYTVAFLADRWSYDRHDTVREITQDLLPRAQWKGGVIRYRGADILRYEGYSEEEIFGGMRESGVAEDQNGEQESLVRYEPDWHPVQQVAKKRVLSRNLPTF